VKGTVHNRGSVRRRLLSEAGRNLSTSHSPKMLTRMALTQGSAVNQDLEHLDRGGISERALNAKYDGRLTAQYASCRRPRRQNIKEAREAPIPASPVEENLSAKKCAL